MVVSCLVYFFPRYVSNGRAEQTVHEHLVFRRPANVLYSFVNLRMSLFFCRSFSFERCYLNSVEIDWFCSFHCRMEKRQNRNKRKYFAIIW